MPAAPARPPRWRGASRRGPCEAPWRSSRRSRDRRRGTSRPSQHRPSVRRRTPAAGGGHRSSRAAAPVRPAPWAAILVARLHRLRRVTFRPLTGVSVVDVTTSLAGPYCTQILAALGADVVKVEPPEGDHTRAWGPPFWHGESTMFLAANAGKRSVALALGTSEGREAMRRLAARADVFVQSMRPGLAERRGLGPDALRAGNPSLVYCSIGSYGRTGPLRDLPGYDPMMQAVAGIVSVTGERGGPGVRAGVSLVDQGTGQWAAIGILAALLAGGGRTIDLSLYETAVALLPYQIAGYLGTGDIPARYGTGFALIAPYEVFRAADGELMIAAANDRLFRALCEALGLDLADDPRFATNPDRVARRDE